MKPIQLKSFLREPLLHFILIGAVLFLLFDWKGKPATMTGGPGKIPSTQIVVSSDALDQIKNQFERTWQRPATAEEEQGLIDELVRNEIFYREAIAIGLVQDDEVLKRRLRQKMEFIYEDFSSWAEPSDDDLIAFVKRNREKYLADPVLSFRQVFISRDKRGNNAESDGRQVLAQLMSGADPDTVGDPTMLAAEVHRLALREINTRFGEDFGKDILEVKPGAWAGPLRSGYGLHLVFVKERRDGRMPDLNEVRDAVKRDWIVEKQKELKDAAYAKIRERYTVIVEKSKTAAAPLSASATTKVKTP
jgi:hypothetical protein